jgi:hypothetical protein
LPSAANPAKRGGIDAFRFVGRVDGRSLKAKGL